MLISLINESLNPLSAKKMAPEIQNEKTLSQRRTTVPFQFHSLVVSLLVIVQERVFMCYIPHMALYGSFLPLEH